MALKVWLGFRDVGTREPLLRKAVRRAINALGWIETTIDECEVGIWWGLPEEHRKWIQKLGNKPYIVIEFPFWGRGNKHAIQTSMFKVSLNGLHPNRHFWQGDVDFTRALRTGAPKIKPWRTNGERILIAGMGTKGCDVYGYSYGEWDIVAAREMRFHSDREIIYRPKPSCKELPSIEGVTIDVRKCSLTALMHNIHTVVTHHGNSAVEALAEGIPVLCNDGVGKFMGLSDFAQIETPFRPDNREEFFAQLAWWQWSYNEIESGAPFRWMLSKGLLNG